LDIKLALIGYILPGLGVVLGIPMALGMVPPNRYYGYRTRRTMASANVWYPANRIAGRCLAIAGLAAVCHNAYFQHEHANWPPATQQFFMAIASGVLMLLGVMVSAIYVRKL
jgi:uncharacterized membrane protein